MKRWFIFVWFVFLLPLGILAQNPNDPVSVKIQNGADGSLEVWGESTAIIPMQVKVEFPKIENLEADTELPFLKVFPAKMPRTLLITLNRPNPNKGWSYKFTYISYPGDTEAVPDLEFPYLLPYGHGTKHKIGQGYFGTFSHNGDSPYALDFDMEIGTPITAARGGLVYEVKQDSNEGGVGDYYKDKGNYVKVLHEDGTMATYVHLKLKGAAVTVGQKVTQGQVLGYSGNTGYSSGPHLHFEVSKPMAFQSPESIPTIFRNQAGDAVALEAGNWVYAAHPDKEAFEEIYGKDLTDKDFASWDEKATTGDKVTIRKQTVDDTVAFFVNNPTKSDMEIKVTLAGDIKPSKTQPVTIKVKAGREAYLCLIKPNKTGGWKYNYSWSYKPLN